MTETMIQAAVAETGESAYAVGIEVSGFHLKGDESVEAGGKGLGPSPYVRCWQCLANARR
jgi:putative redox protein